MNKCTIIWISGLLLLAGSSFTFAEERNGDKGDDAVLRESRLEPVEEEIEFHYFAGQTEDMKFIVEGEGDQVIDVRARLFQLGFSLAAPLDEEYKILNNHQIEGGRAIETAVAITMPLVKRETTFELIYEMKSTDQKEWRAVGRTTIRVYPDDLLKPLVNWSKNICLKVDDREGKLSTFLEKNNIVFLDAREQPLEKNKQTINMVVLKTAFNKYPKKARKEGEAYIYFFERTDTLPKITVQGRIIKVEMPIICHLQEDPLSQKAFLEIIHLIQSAESKLVL